MTLESKTSRVRYIGNGSTVEFSFNFKIWKKDQIIVYVGDGSKESDVTSSVDVSISSTGGTVKFKRAPGQGSVIVIKRNMPYVQEDNYVNGSRFNGEEIEDRFDQDCAERQDLFNGLQRALVFPETSDKTSEEMWTDLENSVQAANSAADNANAAAGDARHAVTWLKDFIADTPEGDLSLYNATAWGSSTSRVVADRFADVVNVKDFGAAGDGVTDDVSAIRGAITYAGTRGAGVFFPAGLYYISDSVDLTQRFYGDGYLYDGTNSFPVNSLADVYVSPSGGGTGLSFNSPTTMLVAKSIVESRKKDNIKIHFAAGTYSLSATYTLTGCIVSFVGQDDANDVIIDGSSLTGINYNCLLFEECDVELSGIKCTSAPNNGIRIQKQTTAKLDNCIFSGNTQNGFSADENCNCKIEFCTALNNGWNGFSFAKNSSGAVVQCVAKGNNHGFICNYTGSLYFDYCTASENNTNGFFLSGCDTIYINNTEANENGVCGFLASGMSRVSIQYTTLSGNNRGVFAEYGADVTICQCDVYGLLSNNSRATVGIAAEYGSRVTIATGSQVSTISNCMRGLWAYYGGAIYLAHPVSSLLQFINCNNDYVPGLDQFGSNGGCIYGGEETSTSLNSMPSFMGQIGDAVLVGAKDFNEIIETGVYSCDGSSSNKPSDFGQTIVSVYKRATDNATRKIVQLCFDMTTTGVALRHGVCLNGDDTSITWGAWRDL